MMSTYKFSAHTSLRRVVFGIATLVAVVAAHAEGLSHPCAASPPPEKLEQVRLYAARLNYVAEPAAFKIVSSTLANNECFWRVDLQGSEKQANTTLFLSPDFKYVTPTLLDLQGDPLDEERKRQKAIAAALSAGRPPVTAGPSNTPVIVEFSDFQCPFCKRETDILEKEVLQGNHDAVRIEYRYFPLSMHSWAAEAAEVAACVQAQSALSFWTVHDFLFQYQSTLTAGHVYADVRNFLSHEKTDLDMIRLDTCVSNHEQTGTVRADEALGRSLGVQATPTMFIDGMMLKGLRTADQLREAIRKARIVANEHPEVVSSMECKPSSPASSGAAQRCTPANSTHE